MKKCLILLLIAAFAVSMVFMGVGCKKEAPAAETTAAETTAAETTAAETTAAEETASAEELSAVEKAAQEYIDAHPDEKISIELWSHSTHEGYKNYYTFVVEEYMKMHPNVTVTFQMFEPDAYSQALKAAVAAGEAPDLIDVRIIHEAVGYARAGSLLDLTDLISNDAEWKSWIEETLTMGLQMWVDEKIWWVPHGNQHIGILYWKDMYPNGFPQTNEELYVEADRLNAEGIVPVALGGNPSELFWEGVIQVISKQFSPEGKNILEMAEAGEIQWTDARIVQTFETFMEMYGKDVYPSNLLELGLGDGSLAMWLSKKAAAHAFSGPWFISAIPEEDLANVGWDIQPAIDAEHEKSTWATVGTVVGVNSAAKYPEIATDILRFSVSPKCQKVLFDNGVLPPGSVGYGETDNPVIIQMKDIIASGVDLSRPIIATDTINLAAMDACAEIVLGTPVLEALEMIQEATDKALGQ